VVKIKLFLYSIFHVDIYLPLLFSLISDLIDVLDLILEINMLVVVL
jgi:hypothetical protein